MSHEEISVDALIDDIKSILQEPEPSVPPQPEQAIHCPCQPIIES